MPNSGFRIRPLSSPYRPTSTDATTKIRPIRLNQAVAQPQPLPPRIELQWYRPPAVGYADAICAIAIATMKANMPPTSQPIPIDAPPAALSPVPNAVMPPATIQMIANEIAKLE